MNKVIIVLALGFMGLISCESKPYFDKTFSFEGKKWDQQVMPKFVVKIRDTNKFYDFILTIRTTTDYKYNNLWVFLNTVTPTGIKAREPFQIRVSNDDGSWIGSKTGTIVENQLLFKRRKFPDKGNFTFMVEQGITDQTIKEVLDIGLRVVEVK